MNYYPLVTIGLVLHKNEAYLKPCLESDLSALFTRASSFHSFCDIFDQAGTFPFLIFFAFFFFRLLLDGFTLELVIIHQKEIVLTII